MLGQAEALAQVLPHLGQTGLAILLEFAVEQFLLGLLQLLGGPIQALAQMLYQTGESLPQQGIEIEL